MCSPWEEAAQPQGERREAAAGAVSISDCPAEERGGGGSSGVLGGRSASLTLPGDFAPALSPAGTARCQQGWMRPLLPAMAGESKAWPCFVLFLPFFPF